MLLVGVPAIFPERGGTAQLFWGLLVCFLSASFYMMAAPYIEDSDDHLAQLAQLQIFLTLLSSLALRAVPPSEAVGNMVTVLLFFVPLSGVIFQTKIFDDLLWLFGKLRVAFMKAFPNFKPPAPKLPLGDTQAGDDVESVTESVDEARRSVAKLGLEPRTSMYPPLCSALPSAHSPVLCSSPPLWEGVARRPEGGGAALIHRDSLGRAGHDQLFSLVECH